MANTQVGGRHTATASPVKAAILQEELAYHLVPRANDHGTNLTGPLLLRHGTPEQRERHLGLLAEGREWWCVGFTEPLAGSDLANIKTRAVARGRQLRPDRPEGLRRMGPTLGLVPPTGPHREKVEGARRADVVPAGHVDARPLSSTPSSTPRAGSSPRYFSTTSWSPSPQSLGRWGGGGASSTSS